ncbi:uncharacterized protein TrAFT101_006277 [Trichoderma asperellum]|uniref:Cyanovirin-N domain-containing protein n=1 Tax=Trichoderma asperellum (strain ATCC 204424 / CBS 433.97 / NBRC 101777) TaxID=1042311 RepID=A0A2T3Z8M0_TRIA4|nr:hypothetical protein M441DRAFT_169160 [Trichoderma asperellum CBS 433.97]PTB41132.1 hypothetical protein M441DRAFT_169160 [Trichoderma asperellum CBS 433.97]UKZ91288.1 hypothetical protein TrAFT101_006277 [Trichoderma asperellum]
MKIFYISSFLAGLTSAATTTLGSIYYEQWFNSDCSGQAFLTGSLTDGFCTVFENFPGESILLTQTTPCPAGTSPQITVSTTNDCDSQPDWTFDTIGHCIEVSIQPQAIHLNCV